VILCLLGKAHSRAAVSATVRVPSEALVGSTAPSTATSAATAVMPATTLKGTAIGVAPRHHHKWGVPGTVYLMPTTIESGPTSGST
jgi:hypothetical protein